MLHPFNNYFLIKSILKGVLFEQTPTSFNKGCFVKLWYWTRGSGYELGRKSFQMDFAGHKKLSENSLWAFNTDELKLCLNT